MSPVVTAFAVFAILSLETVGTAAKLSDERCTFGDKSYSPGETWIPNIRPYGCTTCTCSRRGLVRCESKQCPRLDCLATDKQVLPGHCCPTCTDNLPPELGPPTPKPVRSDCYHSGLRRAHGERFIPTSSGVVPSADNQCTECTCWDGDVLCLLKTCPRVHCAHPVSMPGHCCATCPFGATETTTPGSVLPDEDCRYSGKLYKNGQRWHPEIDKTKCIICRCNNSTIECNKLSCTGSETTPCDRHCCKICPRKESESDRRSCYYIYKQSSRRHLSLSFENKRTGKTVVHTWTIDSGFIKRNETNTIEGAQWRRSDALGVVRSNKYIRFKKRMRRQLEKCKSSCTRRSLQRLVRWLRKLSTSGHHTYC